MFGQHLAAWETRVSRSRNMNQRHCQEQSLRADCSPVVAQGDHEIQDTVGSLHGQLDGQSSESSGSQRAPHAANTMLSLYVYVTAAPNIIAPVSRAAADSSNGTRWTIGLITRSFFIHGISITLFLLPPLCAFVFRGAATPRGPRWPAHPEHPSRIPRQCHLALSA